MNKFLLTAIIALTLFSCNQNDHTEEKNLDTTSEGNKITDTSSIANAADSNSIQNNVKSEDSVRIHILKKGQTLWDLAESYYGNRHYSGVIAYYNTIDPTRLAPGTEIKMPDLDQIFRDINPDSTQYYKFFDQLLQSRSVYMDVEKKLWDLRRKTNFKGTQNIPEEIKEKLITAASLSDSAREGFSYIADKKLASKINSQLKSISANLRELAAGSNDGYGYDLDTVHHNLTYAIEYILSYFRMENKQ